MGNNKKRAGSASKRKSGSGEETSKTKKRKKQSLDLLDLFTTLLRNNIGKTVEDLRDNYSVDLIYALYDKCIRKDYHEYWMNAIITRNAFYSVPGYNDDTKSARSKSKDWNKFLDNLDLESKTEKAKKRQTEKGYLGMFAMARIPIIKKESKK